MATLYVVEQGAVVAKTDGRLVVRKGHEVLQDIPAINLKQIVLFGNVQLTTPAIAFALDEGIDVAFLSSHGKYRGRIQPAWAKNAKLRQSQFSAFLDPCRRLILAQQFVHGKLRNMATICRRQRSAKKTGVVKIAIDHLVRLDKKAQKAPDLAALRGWEGVASAVFYRALSALLLPEAGFRGRNRRPPRDPINAMLSLGYTLLHNDIFAAINIVGFDPYLGLFHEVKHGHAALASDLMEEWRPIIVDSLVLSMINHRQLGPQDFLRIDKQARFTKKGLEKFLKGYNARLASETLHPRFDQRMSYRQCLELQVRHLANVIGDRGKRYSPFLVL
jgi:CRISP-associated protein Cas1